MCPASQDQHRETKQLQGGKMNNMTSTTCTQDGTVRPQVDNPPPQKYFENNNSHYYSLIVQGRCISCVCMCVRISFVPRP